MLLKLVLNNYQFLKYWNLIEDKSLHQKFGEIAETVYFLLNKQEEMFIKRGADILYNIALIDNSKILNYIHELKIFG